MLATIYRQRPRPKQQPRGARGAGRRIPPRGGLEGRSPSRTRKEAAATSQPSPTAHQYSHHASSPERARDVFGRVNATNNGLMALDGSKEEGRGTEEERQRMYARESDLDPASTRADGRRCPLEIRPVARIRPGASILGTHAPNEDRRDRRAGLAQPADARAADRGRGQRLPPQLLARHARGAPRGRPGGARDRRAAAAGRSRSSRTSPARRSAPARWRATRSSS